MAAHRIHSVVVTAAGAPPGVVTDADVVAAAPAGELEMSTAADLAKACAVVRPMDQLETVLARMDERRTTHAVVADRTMRVVGVVSALDIAEEIVRRHDGAVELQ
jgi:CBS domain-containing protein